MKQYIMAKSFIRYEPDIEDGTMFLFNKENGKMIEGNYFSYIVTKSLIEGQDIETIIEFISSNIEQSKELVSNNVDNVLNFLYKEGFLKYD